MPVAPPAAKEAGNLAQEAKATKDKLKHIEKHGFRKNPERGKHSEK